jgi:hypothetical protein
MPKFYYTYGTDPVYPFQGGWTEIEAPDRTAADLAFKAYHPCRPGGRFLNCADVYSEREFLPSDMLLNGNYGLWCQEEITLTRTMVNIESEAG